MEALSKDEGMEEVLETSNVQRPTSNVQRPRIKKDPLAWRVILSGRRFGCAVEGPRGRSGKTPLPGFADVRFAARDAAR